MQQVEAWPQEQWVEVWPQEQWVEVWPQEQQVEIPGLFLRCDTFFQFYLKYRPVVQYSLHRCQAILIVVLLEFYLHL